MRNALIGLWAGHWATRCQGTFKGNHEQKTQKNKEMFNSNAADVVTTHKLFFDQRAKNPTTRRHVFSDHLFPTGWQTPSHSVLGRVNKPTTDRWAYLKATPGDCFEGQLRVHDSWQLPTRPSSWPRWWKGSRWNMTFSTCLMTAGKLKKCARISGV